MTWILIACISLAANMVLLILLFMSARRRSGRPYEALYRRALIEYAKLSSDYLNLLSCLGTGFVPKRLNKTPSVNDIFSK